jgi:hypothetical protein
MAQAARKVTVKDANEKLAHRRLTAGAGGTAGQPRRGLRARRHRPHQLLRWKRRFPLHDLKGPAADRQEPSADPPGGGGADRRAGALAPGVWLQPARGAAGPRGAGSAITI